MEKLKKILHADDDSDILAITEMALSNFGGMELLQVSSGSEAIDACKRFDPDLLLLDYMMPGMTGEDAWHEIRQMPGNGAIPTVFLTANALTETEDRLVTDGAAAVLRKPFDPLTLAADLEKIWLAYRSRSFE